MRSFFLRGVLPLVWLAGCGACPATTCTVALAGGADGMAHVGPALEAVAAQFLGSSSRGEASGASAPSGGFPRLALGRETLSPNSDTPHQRLSDRNLGLRLEVGGPLSARISTFAAVRVATGQSRHLLPQGLGPLADPMRIGVDRVSVTPEAGIRWTHPLPEITGTRADLSLTLSAGQEISRVRTTVRSALLDIRNDSTIRQGFVSLGTGVSLAPARTGLRIEALAEARLMDGGDRLLQTAFRLSR